MKLGGLFKHFYMLHRGFREQTWKVCDTELEPELDWWSCMEAEKAGYTRRFH